MRQYAYSLAAQEFAAKITGHTALRPDQFCVVMEGYDAGHAAQEEECTTAGHFGVASARQPERLTDPDDPRIRDGAECQWVDTPFVIGESPVKASAVRDALRKGGPTADYLTLLLLAPAPDPDADLADAMPIDLTTGWDKGAWLDVFAKVRSVGYEITKAAER